MPRLKQRVSVEDAVGSPTKAVKRKTSPRKARSTKVVQKKSAPAPVVEETTENVRTRKGVVIPPYPIELRDPQLGERTPAVVKWYAENHPEAHAALYEGRTL